MGMGADGGTGASGGWRPRAAEVTQECVQQRTDEPDNERGQSELDAAPDTVIEYEAPAGSCAAPAPVTEHAPTAAYAAPDTVIECVAPAGTCAGPAPVSARRRVRRASNQRCPMFHHRACAHRCQCSV